MSVVEELISGLPRLPQILLGSGWDFILGPSDFKANVPTVGHACGLLGIIFRSRVMNYQILSKQN